jgi:hypothetical protein
MAGIFTTSANGYSGTLSSSNLGPFAAVSGTFTINSGAGPASINTLTNSGGFVTIPNVSIASTNGLAIGCGMATSNVGSSSPLFVIGQIGNFGQQFNVNSNGSLSYAGLSTASGVVPINGMRSFIEMYLDPIQSTSATCTIYVNGVQVATGTVNALPDVAMPLTYIQWGPYGGGTMTLDSFYLCDTTTAHNNNVLGPGVSLPYVPSANGHYTAWTPSSGSLYQCVNQIPPPGDTQYAYAASGPTKMSFVMSGSSLTSVAFGTAQLNMRQDAAGTTTVAAGISSSSGTDSYGSAVGLTQNYASYSTSFNINPVTATAWAVTDPTTYQLSVERVT